MSAPEQYARTVHLYPELLSVRRVKLPEIAVKTGFYAQFQRGTPHGLAIIHFQNRGTAKIPVFYRPVISGLQNIYLVWCIRNAVKRQPVFQTVTHVVNPLRIFSELIAATRLLPFAFNSPLTITLILPESIPEE